MPLSKQHKQRTRAEILTAAGALFRAHGYHGVGIDTIMANAGLTRGGFYAHFNSKAELFDEILRNDHGLLRRLRERDVEAATPMPEQATEVLGNYLEPAHLEMIKTGCTFAALAGDAAKDGAHARKAFTAGFKDYLAELGVGMSKSKANRRRATLTSVLSVGAIMLAGAIEDDELKSEILLTCKDEVERLMAA